MKITKKINKKTLFIIITLVFLIICSTIYFIFRPHVSFSSNISIPDQIQITSDVLNGEYKDYLISGYGIDFIKKESEFCKQQNWGNCEYISCKIHTSPFGTDYVPCSIEKDNSGKYVIHNSL